MKIKMSVVISLCIILLSACNNNNSEILETVWEQLTYEQRSEIIGGWKSGIVEELIAENSNYYNIDNDYMIGKEVLLVTYKSEKEPLSGNIKVLVDKESLEVIGEYYRE
ncbi:hypothetical protein RJG79_09150 [Mycoplasmatota bacterium WC44]